MDRNSWIEVQKPPGRLVNLAKVQLIMPDPNCMVSKDGRTLRLYGRQDKLPLMSLGTIPLSKAPESVRKLVDAHKFPK
jgi:hypothetical protein